MKRAYLKTAMALLLTLGLVGPSHGQSSKADGQKVTLRVDGLACPFCAYGLEKKLKKIDGVEKLDIKIDDGLVLMTFKTGAKVDREVIAKRVKEAGFTLREFSLQKDTLVAAEKPKTNGRAISLEVKGMACEGCASRVEVALSDFDCVSDVQVDLKAGVATITCTDEKMDEQKLVDAVEKLGFKAKVIKEKGDENR
jgi:mercuric ion binding protein